MKVFKRTKLWWDHLRWSIKERVISFKLSFLKNDFDCYVVDVENTTYDHKKAVIFGYNQFFHVANFGSDSGVKVTNKTSSSPNGYAQLLCESQLKTRIKVIKYFGQSKPINEWPILWVKKERAFGWMSSTPVSPQGYLDPYQQQSQMIDIVNDLDVDGGTHFEIMLGPQEKITLCFLGSKKNRIIYEHP